jgi:hypothetical protein
VPSTPTTPHVPPSLLARLFQRKVIPFIGAGSSVGPPSSIPTADQLVGLLVSRGVGSPGQALEDIAEDLWAAGGWQAFAEALPIDEWRARTPNDVFRVVAEICKEGLISRILTTNWDVLIEAALAQIGQPYSKVVDSVSLAVEPAGEVTVVKLNGCIDHPRFIKATRSQIQSLEWLEAWIDALFDVSVRVNSLLFAGYSGASRAATTTISQLVEAGERHAEDYLVDRSELTQITLQEPGRGFMAAINVIDYRPNDAIAFFRELRELLFPMLLQESQRRAVEMAARLIAPTTIDLTELDTRLRAVIELRSDAGPSAFQYALRRSFITFPDCDAVQPYIPLLPNSTEIGKLMLCLGALSWADRLADGESPRLTLSGAGSAALSSHVQLEVIVCNPEQRSDSAANTVVADLERERGSAGPAALAIGVMFGGLASVARCTRAFSVTRGSGSASAARGGLATIVWIDGDSLFTSFAPDQDAASVRTNLNADLDRAAEDLAAEVAA